MSVDKPHTTPSLLEFTFLLLLGVLWGIPYALTKISLETIPPITLTAARVSIAATALWIVVAVTRRDFRLRLDRVGRLFVQSCVTCVVPYTFIALGQQTVDSALAAILNSTTPLFVYLISVTCTHHEAMTVKRLSGALVGLTGVVLIAGASALSGLGRESAGQVAIMIATLSSAIAVIHGRRFADMPPEAAAAATLTCAAVVLVPFCLAIEQPWHMVPSLRSVAALVVNAVGATAFGFVLYFRLIRTIGSMGTASTGYLKPAVSVLIGCTLLGEPFTWILGIGLFAVLFGVAAINDKMPITLFAAAFKRLENSALWSATARVIPIVGQGKSMPELRRP
jgi:drug/metabolite transporter (DMT)-like permease